MDLNNAKILVTGGTLGIGRATAELFIEAGAKVAITGRDAARVAQAAGELGALGITADVSKEEDVDRTYEELLAEFGSLDVLINNAGVGIHKPLTELTPEDMHYVWSVNVLGCFMMAKKAAELFIKQNSGNIVNIASTSGLKGYANGTAYSSSKFALKSMTQCWQGELRKHNVRVILVNPSEVTTAFANPDRIERAEEPKKLRSIEIAHSIKSALEMDDRGFIPELTVFATNPF